MAVVGEAHVVVRAITNQVKDDIRRGFDGADQEGRRAGQQAADGYGDGFSRGSRRNSRMFSSLRAEALQAGEAFNRLVTTGYALGPALSGLVGIVGALGGGLFAIGAQAAAAGPALMSLLNVMTALAQAGAVLKVVFSGIGAAFSAGMRGGSGGGGGGGVDVTEQIEAAKERVEDARKALARVYQQNAEALKRANEQITDALEAESEAYDRLEDAERGVQRAEEDLFKAQEDVNRAREEAIEQVQQLRFELEDAILSEERAALGLEKAREELAKVANLPPDNRARREAELAFKEADLRLRRAKDNTNDTQKEVDEANAKGIEGSDLVVSAKERERAAEEALVAAKENVVDAEKDLARATRDVTEAYDNYNATLAENKARLEDARDSLQDAKDALEDIKNSAGAGGAGGGVDAFAQAMANLSPKAQEFVRLLLGIAEAFKPIKFAAQDEFFTPFNEGVALLADTYLPILEEKLPKTAGILGEIGKDIAETLSSSENVARITAIWDSNDEIIKDFGDAVSDLAESALILLKAAAPLAEELSEWVKNVAEGWKESLKADEKTGKLAKTFDYAAGVAKTLFRIVGNIAEAIFNVGKAAAGPGSGGEMLLNMLEDVTEKWEKFTGSEEGQKRLEDFFKNIVPLVSEVGGLIGDVFKAFFTTAEAGTQGEDGGPLAGFVRSLREVVRILSEQAPSLMGVLPTIGGGLESAATAISNLMSSGAIQVFFDVLKAFADFAADVTGSAVFQTIFAVVAPVFAFSRGLSLVYKFMKFIFLGSIVSNVVKVGSGIATLAGGNGIKGLVAAVKSGQGPFKFLLNAVKLLKFGFGPIGLIIMGVVAAFIAMWNESEIFRNAIKDLIEKVIAKAIEVFNNLKEKVEKALEPLGGAEGVIDGLKKAFKFLGDIIGTYVIPFLENGLMNAFAIVEGAIGFLIDFIGNLIAAFSKIWEGIQTGDVGMIFEGIVDAITAPFRALWDNLKQIVTDVFNNFVNLVKDLLGISSPSQVFADIGQSIIDGLINVLTFLPKTFLKIFTTAWEKVSSFFTDTVGPFLLDLPGKIAEWIGGLWDSLFSFLEDVWENISEFFGPGGTLANALADLIVNVGEWLTGVWDTFWSYLEDIWKTVSEFFGPGGTVSKALATLITNVGTWLKGVWDKFWSYLEDVWKKITAFYGPGGTVATELGKLPGRVTEWLKNVWDGFKDALDTVWGKIKDFFTREGAVGTFLLGLPAKFVNWLKDVWDGLMDALNGENGVWGKIKNFFGPGGTVATWFSGLPAKITSWAAGIWDGMASSLRSTLKSITDGWNSLSFTLGPVDSNVFTEALGIAGKSLTISTPDIRPAFLYGAKGGTFSATRGGIPTILAEAGRDERVEPLDPDGLSRRDKAMINYLTGGNMGGGTTINVYPSPGMDERELAEKVSRELAFMMRRGSV